MRGLEQIELVVRLAVRACPRQLFEDRIQAHLGVVDLGRQRVAFRLQCIAFFAHLCKFRACCFRLGTRLGELLFER